MSKKTTSYEWFEQVYAGISKIIEAMSRSRPHRSAAAVGFACIHAKALRDQRDAPVEEQLQHIAMLLASICYLHEVDRGLLRSTFSAAERRFATARVAGNEVGLDLVKEGREVFVDEALLWLKQAALPPDTEGAEPKAEDRKIAAIQALRPLAEAVVYFRFDNA